MEATAPSLRRRIALAIGLTVAFYALALALVAGLATQPLWTRALFDVRSLWVTGVCWLTALAILRAIVPDRARYEPPGPRLTREAQPELHAFLDDVAARAGDRPVDEVYLAPGVNASVMEVPRRGRARDRGAHEDGRGEHGPSDRGHRFRRVMHLGLPVLQAVDHEALAAIVAHEHGHYVGGDTRAIRWVGRTGATVDRTVERLKGSERRLQNMMAYPFRAYRALFLRITGAVSRREETVADARAARTVGAEAHARALVELERAGLAFPAYLEHNLEPALAGGVHPPIAEGFGRMLATPLVRADLDDLVLRGLAEEQPDPRSTHPTTTERLTALGVEGPAALPAVAEDAPPAITLLRDVRGLERALLTDAASLRGVSWEEVGDLAIVEGSRHLVAVNADLLEGRPVADAGAIAHEPQETYDRAFADDPPIGDEHAIAARWVIELLTAAVIVAAHDAGWTIQALPGEPRALVRGTTHFQVGVLLEAVRRGQEPPERWTTLTSELGLADLPLVPSDLDEAAAGREGDAASEDDPGRESDAARERPSPRQSLAGTGR